MSSWFYGVQDTVTLVTTAQTSGRPRMPNMHATAAKSLNSLHLLPMESSKKRLAIALGGLTLAVVLLLLYERHTRMTLLPIHHHLSTSPVAAANATLGFGAVLAVSRTASPRREGLLYAANLTGIDIVIPQQPIWTDADVENFRDKGKSHITKGSVMAWMGHLNALRWFLSTSLSTALILEDDVDWDIHLRTTQIPLVATAARHLLSNSSPHIPSNLDHSPNQSPNNTRPPRSPLDMLSSPRHHSIDADNALTFWPHPTQWSILYLGHCTPPPTTLPPTSLAYHDPTLHTSTHLTPLSLPPSTRLFHKSDSPLCTFAYAVTRASAQKILADYSSEGEGGCDAFDVRILEACRDHAFVEGEGKGDRDRMGEGEGEGGYKCYSVSPELFHHLQGGSEIHGVNVESGGDGRSKSKSNSKNERKGKGKGKGNEEETGKRNGSGSSGNGVGSGIGSTKPTKNIPCRARHPGFFVDVETEGGVEAVEWLKDVVGRQGNCLVDWAEEDMGMLE
ncbi:glycosyltransferase family 25 protein [Lophiostoma macrostomum CBS 122681]|uniref:Glycosyltransferase family 25 protein n=1 Tax=Lophiostoma macrostomum CBS 122681 TaxID=1314788 RepID=A0A6A6SKW7_9PLEO|nr:glycosyltransferase family 25 protein [Lophiostoma macrostomum CBS 122681]